MNSNLLKLYQKVNSLPLTKLSLPEKLGEGRIIKKQAQSKSLFLSIDCLIQKTTSELQQRNRRLH